MQIGKAVEDWNMVSCTIRLAFKRLVLLDDLLMSRP
jgi:hypothetical protein